MGNFQDLLNRFRKGEFNYEQMGNIPEVRQRTNTILNDPRQMFLNTDANYRNMGNSRGVVPNSTINNTDSPGAPSQMPMDMGGGIGDLFNRLLNRRMQNLGTGDLMGRMSGMG
tara:strand:+ start:38 stop:376 length:339 start_codon:yes stop_codon:yes gene_type:complete